MPVDFSSAAKAARAQIAVPAIDVEAICTRSRTGVGVGLRARVVSWAMALGVLGTAAAFAANTGGMRVWLLGDKATVAISSFAMVQSPTAADLERVARSATFRVVFPVGLPSGTHVKWIIYAPDDRPNNITIQYTNTDAKFNLGLTLVDSSIIAAKRPSRPPGVAEVTDTMQRWTVGSETVLAVKRFLPDPRMRTIRAAMLGTTPAESLAATQSMAARAILIGWQPHLADVAQQYADSDGSSVFLDTMHTNAIPKLAAADKPVQDPRMSRFTHIPSRNGAPDYQRATIAWNKTIAIPAAGVRAVNAMLHASGDAGSCGCGVLYAGLRDGSYTIWKISAVRPFAAAKYSVDAKTLKVTRLRS